MDKFGCILENTIKERGIRKSDLSRMTGITKSTFSKYVRGTINISLHHLILIADALNVSIDELIGRNIK